MELEPKNKSKGDCSYYPHLLNRDQLDTCLEQVTLPLLPSPPTCIKWRVRLMISKSYTFLKVKTPSQGITDRPKSSLTPLKMENLPPITATRFCGQSFN